MHPPPFRYTFFGALISTVCALFLLLTNRLTVPSLVHVPMAGQSKARRVHSVSNKLVQHFGSDRRIPSVTSLHDRFTHLTEDACNNTLCRPAFTNCEARTHDEWIQILESKKLKGTPLFPENEYFFPWEWEYLSSPPLSDITSLPSLNLSKVYIFSGDKDKTMHSSGTVYVVLNKNVPATFRVELLDGYGRRRIRGGDEVRAWLVGQNYELTFGNRVWATAMVKDHGNGSYDVIATPTWVGVATLNVAVTYPREYIRTSIHHYRIGSHRFIFGKFNKGNIEEVTLCHSTPNVPGRPCVCNMTKVNSQPYYCGKPLDTRLSCSDWTEVNTVREPGFLDMTPAETALDKHISRPPKKALIRHNMNIIIEEGEDITLPLCRVSNRRTSWTKTSPRGSWSRAKYQWNSFVCREAVMTLDWIQTCLQSTSVWMIGDSNIRYMATHLSKQLGCLESELLHWPATSRCRIEAYNTTIEFRPHEYPLYVASRWLPLPSNGAITDTLQIIPSTGNHIVILHYYLHFSSSHLSVLQQRLSALKEAVSKLLSRNPEVLVVIRGPHTSAVEWEANHMFAGDIQGTFIRDIYVDAFRDLHDSVVFLDGWDMSISFENLHFHPPAPFMDALWRTILSYKCD